MDNISLVRKYVRKVSCGHCGGSGKCKCDRCKSNRHSAAMTLWSLTHRRPLPHEIEAREEHKNRHIGKNQTDWKRRLPGTTHASSALARGRSRSATMSALSRRSGTGRSWKVKSTRFCRNSAGCSHNSPLNPTSRHRSVNSGVQNCCNQHLF